jgi:predicted aldo/keto reductase-like oxidoreductase
VLMEQYGMERYAKTTYKEAFQSQVRRCTECNSCMERCPSQLNIPDLLKKTDLILS